MQELLDSSIWPEFALEQLMSTMAEALHGARAASRTAPRGASFAAIAKSAGFETESTELWGVHAESILRDSAPALLHISGRGWLAVLDAQYSEATLLRPDLAHTTISVSRLTFALVTRHDGPYRTEIEGALNACAASSQQSRRAIGELMRERLRCTSVASVWRLRPARSRGFWAQWSVAPIWRVAQLRPTRAAENLLWLTAWLALGREIVARELAHRWNSIF